MKQFKNIFGYLLGLVLFVGLMPTLMWLASGRPEFWSEDGGKSIIACGMMLGGLLLSIWTIVYMKLRGKGNPMDAFGHEVAPRTQHLMTDGPYRLSRNPMLSGTYIYYLGILIALWSGWAVTIFASVTVLMNLQVYSEEKRLEADFGEEYLADKKTTGRFFTLKR